LILLDTDVLIEIFEKGSRKGDEAIQKIEELGEDIVITSLNLHEPLYGLYKHAGAKKLNKVYAKLLLLEILEFEKRHARLSARLEAESERKGRELARLDAEPDTQL